MQNHEPTAVVLRLEAALRDLHGCTRYGLGGIVDADYIKENPFLAMCMCLAPFYLQGEGNEELDSFINQFRREDMTGNFEGPARYLLEIVEKNKHRLER